MRFSTIFAASVLLFAGFSAATVCRDPHTHTDCPRGEVCCFHAVTDSQGHCYSRGEAPPGCLPNFNHRARRSRIARSIIQAERAAELAARREAFEARIAA